MITQQRLDTLRQAREGALNRLLLLARRNFILRVGEIQELQGIPPIPPAALALLPFIDLAGTRGSSLAERAGISKQAAGKGVRILERMGLLARRADATDARAWRICFTGKGIDYMNRALATIEQAERELEARLGPAKLRTLKRLLAQLAHETPVAARHRRRGA